MLARDVTRVRPLPADGRLSSHGLRKLYVEPTNRCNISCATCVRNAWAEPMGEVPLELYERLALEFGGMPDLKCVQFGGYGEPLLHPDIARMVKHAHERGLRTELLTNGLLLSEDASEALCLSGLDAIILSLDGASPETYSRVRRGSDLPRVAENVRRASRIFLRIRQTPPEIGIVFVAMKSNFAEFGALRSLAGSLGASFVMVTNLLPHSREMADEILYGRDHPTAFEPHIGRWSPEISIPRMDFNEQTTGPLLDLLRNHSNVTLVRTPLYGSHSHCPFVGEGRAGVSWEGAVSPCLALMHSYTCFVAGREKKIRRYAVGSLREQKLSEIWNDTAYVSFRDRVSRFDFPPCSDCGSCELAASNEEDCLGNAFPVCGDCLWARGVLLCP